MSEDQRIPRYLERLGLTVKDIDVVFLGHLHFDHAGGLFDLPDCEVHVHRQELAAARTGQDGGVFGDEITAAEGWRIQGEGYELAAGVRALLTPGHTAGHMSLLVELPHGRPVVLCGDAADLQENLDDEVAPGFCWNNNETLALQEYPATQKPLRALKVPVAGPITILRSSACDPFRPTTTSAASSHRGRASSVLQALPVCCEHLTIPPSVEWPMKMTIKWTDGRGVADRQRAAERLQWRLRSWEGAAPAYPDANPGQLLQTPPQLLTTITAAQMLLQLTGASNQQIQQVLGLVGSPVCDIAVYHIEYATVGGANEATTASGALMVPTGSHSGCTGRSARLCTRKTPTDRGFNIADLTNQQNAEGIFLAAAFASQGYIVVAPNYVGYDTSTLPYDAFLVGDQQSGEMIDALTAARSALPTADASSTSDSGKLFITGYSQGGYVALATHRAMQARSMPATASAPMSGLMRSPPFVDAIFDGQVNAGSAGAGHAAVHGLPAFLWEYLYRSYRGVRGAVRNRHRFAVPDHGDARRALYGREAPAVRAVWAGRPPRPLMPRSRPRPFRQTWHPYSRLGFGAGNLITNSIASARLTDAQANPDGAFPTVTTGVPAASPGLAMRAALKQNDLRSWLPSASVLCGGDQDPEVFWFNAQLEQNYWLGQPAAVPVTMLDLDASIATGDLIPMVSTYEAAKDAVAALAITQGATDGGYEAVETAYHTNFAPPAWARSTFDAR